jgi:hypothetical protein
MSRIVAAGALFALPLIASTSESRAQGLVTTVTCAKIQERMYVRGTI